jgi:hypothetical protein
MASQSTIVEPGMSDREDTPLLDIRNIKDPIYDYSAIDPFGHSRPLTILCTVEVDSFVCQFIDT